LDTVLEQAGETSVINLQGLDFADLTTKRNGNDLTLSWLGRDQGLVLKDYYTQAHQWKVADYTGEERLLADVLSDNIAQQAMLTQVTRLEKEFIANWRTNMATGLLADGYVHLADGRFEKKPEVSFQYSQSTYSSASGNTTSEYGLLAVSNWIFSSLKVVDLTKEGLDQLGIYLSGLQNEDSYSLQNVKLSGWKITQGSKDYDQYSTHLVTKSGLFTFPEGVSGIKIPSGFNVHYSATDQPRTYFMTWTEVQKTLDYHEHIIGAAGQAKGITALPTNGSPQPTAEDLGHRVLAGQALPNQFVVGKETRNLSLLRVEGTEGNDQIVIGNQFGEIVHGYGGDDTISLSGNEDLMAKGFLDGGDGNDALIGRYFDDVLVGGNGFNYLNGHGGANRYIISGDGIDLIDSSILWRGENSVIELPEGVTFDMLSTQFGYASYGDPFYGNGQFGYGNGDTLNLNWQGKTHVMVALYWFGDLSDQAKLRFADGTIVSLKALIDNTQANNNAPYLSVNWTLDYKSINLNNRNNIIKGIHACIIANATGIETKKMKEISDVKENDLDRVNKNHIRYQTLYAANDTIMNHTAKLPIFAEYNLADYGVHASVDGQKLVTKYHTIKSRHAKKYFGRLKGVVLLVINANHLPLCLKVIGANQHESHFLLDIVESNTSDVEITAISGDMHSINRVNFALLYMFGYRFMPRFTQLQDKSDHNLVCFDELDNYKRDIIKPSKKVNKALIIKEWDMVLRILASLALKKTTQSQIVSKLSSYKKTSPALKALIAFDEIIMTDYLLDYIDSKEIREVVQGSLNRGESYHQLSSAIAKVSGGRMLCGKTEIELDINAESIRLIANAVIFYNATLLSELYQHYQSVDPSMAKQILRFSPVAWQHINFIGKYEFYNRGDVLNIQELIKNLIASFEIDISSVSRI
jgi:TnpA family transposase